MRVLAFRHAPLEGVGLIGDALERHRIECDVVDLYAQPDVPLNLAGVAGLILMGGSMSVNDDLPWLRREEEVVRDAVERGVPVLGVCLGSQLIAKALGARVYRNPVKEIGWAAVSFTEAARGDRLFGGLSHPETVFHWHGETFELPRSAELLAYSESCARQAFRVGDNIYGLQFHLEVTPTMIEDWLRQDESCGAAREATCAIDPHGNSRRAGEVATMVFDRWCSLLR